MKSKSAVLIALVFVVVLVLLVVFELKGHQGYQFLGTPIDPPVAAYNFSLPDADGNTFRLSDQLGKVVLLFFGYTHCMDVCPTTLAKYKVIYNELGVKADQVRFVFISVDPQRDTPEITAQYVTGFNPAFFGLSGNEMDLIPIYDHYGVFREKQNVQSADNYLMGHTSIIYVIDKQGEWRLTFPYEMGPYDMVKDVAFLVDE